MPVSDETRRRMSESSWTGRASSEQLEARNARISATKRSMSPEEREMYSQRVSEGRKGKGLGNAPWNKGKKVGRAWNSGVPMSEETKEILRKAYESLPEEEKRRRALVVGDANRGRKPWNVGMRFSPTPEQIREAKAKEYETKKRNGTFNTSSLEEAFYRQLVEAYGEGDVIRQYSSEKYPFACDFYVVSEDRYIELHGNWTHGGRPFDLNDESCIAQLEDWERKAETSDYYKNAIYTWTDLDVRKRECAIANGLDYEVLYGLD